MPPRYVLAIGGEDPGDSVRDWALAHAEKVDAPLVTMHVERSEPVSKSLAEFVRDEDVLVIGTGKTGFIHSRVYGARGVQIAASVPCSVAVIPNIDLRFRSGVVAGVENDALWPIILEAAAEEASARSETLQLVHSTFSGFVPAPVRFGTPVLERAASAAKTRWPHLSVRTRISARPPAGVLLDASRNAALLVLGGDGEEVFGSVTHDVLVNINAPVLIARRPHRLITSDA